MTVGCGGRTPTEATAIVLGHLASVPYGTGAVTAAVTQQSKCPFSASEQVHSPGDFVWARGVRLDLTQPAASVITGLLDSSGDSAKLSCINGSARTVGQYRPIIEPAGEPTGV